MSQNNGARKSINILELDDLQAMTGRIPEGEHPHLRAYLNHYRDWNAKKCEASGFEENSSVLLQLRALLFRGRHEDAEEMIREIKSTEISEKDFSEVLLQKARFAALKGEWRSCFDFCAVASVSALPALSRLTLFQVEALACFELGDFEKADGLLERAESLATTFPYCTSAAYTKILQIKVAARRLGGERAKEMLACLWQELKTTGQLDLNLVQALLRAEVDLSRLLGAPHFELAYASLLIAEAMGEKLYIALGVFDCYHALAPKERFLFELKLKKECKEFPRVAELMREVQPDFEAPSTTATTVQIYLSQQGEVPAPVLQENSESIALLPMGLLVHLKTNKCHDLSLFPQLLQAIRAFGTIMTSSKEDFFRAIWGRQKYAPHLHENLIFGVQQRLKSKLGLKLQSKNNQLTLPNLFVLS